MNMHDSKASFWLVFFSFLSACVAASSGNRPASSLNVKTGGPQSSLKHESKEMGLSPHGADFFTMHKFEAGENSRQCASCHTESQCLDCHEGRVKPKLIHPNDFLSLHAAESKRPVQTHNCDTCHSQQGFCVTCHQRLGISETGPSSLNGVRRIHPPKESWTDGLTRPGHHGDEARKNLQSCTSCHVERDCVRCHGAQGVGAGYSPHPKNFASRCKDDFSRNLRPCLTCHQQNASALDICR